MRRSASVPVCAATCLFVLLLSGGCSCSSGPQRKPIYGKIVSPREVNVITLQPSPDLAAPAVTTTVVDGAYQFSKEDGPIPGSYQAVFTFADTNGGFSGGTSGNKKEFVRPTAPTPKAPPAPPPPTEVPITVPAEGSLEINITLP